MTTEFIHTDEINDEVLALCFPHSSEVNSRGIAYSDSFAGLIDCAGSFILPADKILVGVVCRGGCIDIIDGELCRAVSVGGGLSLSCLAAVSVNIFDSVGLADSCGSGLHRDKPDGV